MSTYPRDLEHLVMVADGLPVGICVRHAQDGRVVYANEAYGDIVGGSPGAERPDPDGFHARNGTPYPQDRLPFARAVREKRIVLTDDVVIHRDGGAKVFVRAFARPVLDATGDVTHVVIALTDITETVEERSRADLVEQRLLHLLAQAPLILFSFDRHGIVTLSEGRGLYGLGFRPKELLGLSVYEIYANDRWALSNANRVLGGEEFTVSRAEGPIVLETTFTPVRNEAGEVEGAIGVSIDVTEREKMHARLVQSERLASMGTLSATIAHEINNPLTYVLGNLDLVSTFLSEQEATATTNRLAGWARQAREGADRVRRIVRGLRVFSRQGDDRMEPTEVLPAIEHALDMTHNVIRHRARLVRRLEPVPPVVANDLRLGQVFVNLLLNAAHAIPEGHADENEVRISTSHDRADGMVVVTVEDTGTGITPEVKSRIFEPFFTTKPVGEGTGLGLSICYGIVSGFGGGIEVDSAPGAGAIFRVRLPASGPAHPPDAIPRAPYAPIRRGRILIVDDDANVARSFAFRLRDDHDVVVSLRPRDMAGRILAGDSFDIIFCDLMMPDMTGMEFHATIAEREPRQAERIVFVTGGAFTPAAASFVARVPNTFLEKPFDKTALDAVLASYLGNSPGPGRSSPE